MEKHRPFTPMPAFAITSAFGSEKEPGAAKRFDYDANRPGRVMVDGIDTDIRDLTEAERVLAGEQLLKRVSLESGVPVSELRQHMNEVAEETRKKIAEGTINPPVRQMVTLASGAVRPFLANQGMNRKARRAARRRA